VLFSLRAAHSADVIADWRAMAVAGRFVKLAEELMSQHYDPRYGKHRARMEVPLIEVAADDLADLDAVADRVAEAVCSMIMM
jgi:tRNA 2-selenouridine synthase